MHKWMVWMDSEFAKFNYFHLWLWWQLASLIFYKMASTSIRRCISFKILSRQILLTFFFLHIRVVLSLDTLSRRANCRWEILEID